LSGFQQDFSHRFRIPDIARLAEGTKLAIFLVGTCDSDPHPVRFQEKSSRYRNYYLLAFNSSLHPN
jgi:hypothetical protein